MQYDENSCSCGQLVIGSFIMTMHLLTHPVSYRVFLVKHPITQVTQPPYSPNLAPCDFWLFQKLKSPLKQKTFHTNWWDLGKYNEAADGNWEICVRSQGAYFEGDWGVIVLWTMFLVSSSINVSVFHIAWMDTFCTDSQFWLYPIVCSAILIEHAIVAHEVFVKLKEVNYLVRSNLKCQLILEIVFCFVFYRFLS